MNNTKAQLVLAALLGIFISNVAGGPPPPPPPPNISMYGGFASPSNSTATPRNSSTVTNATATGAQSTPAARRVTAQQPVVPFNSSILAQINARNQAPALTQEEIAAEAANALRIETVRLAEIARKEAANDKKAADEAAAKNKKPTPGTTSARSANTPPASTVQPQTVGVDELKIRMAQSAARRAAQAQADAQALLTSIQENSTPTPAPIPQSPAKPPIPPKPAERTSSVSTPSTSTTRTASPTLSSGASSPAANSMPSWQRPTPNSTNLAGQAFANAVQDGARKLKPVVKTPKAATSPDANRTLFNIIKMTPLTPQQIVEEAEMRAEMALLNAQTDAELTIIAAANKLKIEQEEADKKKKQEEAAAKEAAKTAWQKARETFEVAITEARRKLDRTETALAVMKKRESLRRGQDDDSDDDDDNDDDENTTRKQQQKAQEQQRQEEMLQGMRDNITSLQTQLAILTSMTPQQQEEYNRQHSAVVPVPVNSIANPPTPVSGTSSPIGVGIAQNVADILADINAAQELSEEEQLDRVITEEIVPNVQTLMSYESFADYLNQAAKDSQYSKLKEERALDYYQRLQEFYGVTPGNSSITALTHSPSPYVAAHNFSVPAPLNSSLQNLFDEIRNAQGASAMMSLESFINHLLDAQSDEDFLDLNGKPENYYEQFKEYCMSQ